MICPLVKITGNGLQNLLNNSVYSNSFKVKYFIIKSRLNRRRFILITALKVAVLQFDLFVGSPPKGTGLVIDGI